jgi:hypothetical protein
MEEVGPGPAGLGRAGCGRSPRCSRQYAALAARALGVYQLLVGQPLLPVPWVQERLVSPAAPLAIVKVSPLVDVAVTV